jgi:hypothetical protein
MFPVPESEEPKRGGPGVPLSFHRSFAKRRPSEFEMMAQGMR